MRRCGSAPVVAALVTSTGGCIVLHNVLSAQHRSLTRESENQSTSVRNATPASRSYPKLDLNLQLDKIDFAKVVQNTREAENVVLRTSSLTRSVLEELEGLQRSLSSPRGTTSDKKSDHKVETAEHPSPTTSLKYRTPISSPLSSAPPLKQRLHDCLVTGDWPTAVKLFDRALTKSLEHVGCSVATAASSPLTEKTLPSPGATSAFFGPEMVRVGVGRWNGNHLRTLLQCLILAEAHGELDRIWRLLRHLDAFRRRFDAFIVNGLLVALQRRNNTAGAQWRDQQTVQRLSRQESEERARQIRDVKRQCAVELGELAKEQGWNLRESSWEIVEWFRANKDKEGNVAAGSPEVPTMPSSPESSTSATNPALSTATWNKMLQEAATYEQAKEILRKMDSLAITTDDTTYALVVRCAARCPQIHDASVAQDGKNCETGPSVDSPAVDAATATPMSREVDSSQDADRNLPLVWDALGRFQSAFPGRYPSSRLMVEVLYLLKGRRRHDAKVYEMVGLMLVPGESARLLELVGPNAKRSRPSESSETVNGAVETPAAPELVPLDTDAGSKKHVQLAAVKPALNWGSRPSGKLFETMIRHSLHMQRYLDCWWWYEEMLGNKVKGTGVVYHTMIEVASAHGDAQGLKANGRAAVLVIYRDMRDAGHDVTGVNTTVNLINAWTSNRHRHP